MHNEFIHLTNVAVQKGSESYDHEGKWNLDKLWVYLDSHYPPGTSMKVLDQIKFVICHSLYAVKPMAWQDKHCFEVYGYDILLDEHLKPWLVEVNASPSLLATSDADRRLKLAVMNDTLNILFPDTFLSKSLGVCSDNNSHIHLHGLGAHQDIGGYLPILGPELGAGESDEKPYRKPSLAGKRGNLAGE